MGVFATRSPHRPNPIGLSLVEIEKVENNGIWIRGIDLLDGTPVLDIKPYLPSVEAKPEALSGWSGELASVPATQIEWSEQAANALDRASSVNIAVNLTRTALREMIEQTISLDPRPLVYQTESGSESHYRDSHVMQIENLDVHFYFKSHQHAVILDLKPATLSTR